MQSNNRYEGKKIIKITDQPPNKTYNHYIDMANTQLSKLRPALADIMPSVLQKMGGKLFILAINDNRLDDLDGINNIAGSLIQLKCNSNRLTNLNGLGNLNFPYLQKVFFEFNRIEDISNLITSRFPVLQRLTLDGNRLKTSDIEEVFPKLSLPCLKILGLQQNLLDNADFIKHMQIPKLLFLALSENRISMVSFFYSGQKFEHKISRFSIHTNKLVKFPNCQCNFSNLSQIMLNNNQLESVEGICRCSFTHLQVLDIQKNLLTSTSFLRKLCSPNLIDLKLAQNKINCLSGLRSSFLPRLQQILLKRNQISNDIVAEILASLVHSRPQKFQILSAWNNKQILKKKNYYTFLKQHFPLLSFLQL